MIRKGQCHCGAVQFEADLPQDLMPSRCNCSICAMKGVVMAYVQFGQLTITSGEDALGCYQFNTRVAKHYFCSNCGIHCFHQARSDPDKYGVNISCLKGVSALEDYPHVPVADGQNHSLDNGGTRKMAGVLHFEPSPDGEWNGLNNLAK